MGKTVDKSGVLDFIRNSKLPVTKGEILKETGFKGDFRNCIVALQKDHEELKMVGSGKLAAYIWKPAAPIYSEMKNPEGYSDSTAGKAIANLMKQMSRKNGGYPMRQSFGEVWARSDVRDDCEGVLVISANEGICICYNVYDYKKFFMKEGYTFSWEDEKCRHYISLTALVNIGEIKLTKLISKLSEEDSALLKAELAKIFPFADGTVITKIKEVPLEVKVPVEVEKVVEKRVEVPVEVIKEVPVEVEKVVEKVIEQPCDQREIELAVLKAKNEIYERLIFGENPLKKSGEEVQKAKAARIADLFDDFLESKGIIIPNEYREPGNDTPIYGIDWAYILDSVYEIIDS